MTDQEIIELLKSGKSYRELRALGVGDRRVKRLRDQAKADNNQFSLESRILSLSDENIKLKSRLRDNQREYALFESLVSELHKAITPLTPPKKPKFEASDKHIVEACVMHLSDEHADAIVRREQVGGLEEYNFDIALGRAEKYVDRVLKFTQETLQNYKFDSIWVLAYGDHTHGEIHDATNHTAWRNQFRNCLAISQMHALMLYDLAQHFPEVNVLYLPGNHGRRRDRKKNFHEPKDSWDYLVGETTRLLCARMENVNFAIPNSYLAVVEINGWNFAVSHGDDIRSWNNIPWYGIERKTRRLSAIHSISDERIHYYVLGHFHQPSTVAQMDGETIINGAWLGTDPYVYNALGAYTEPSQWLHGVHHKHGISWRLKVALKTFDPPTRYAVSLSA